MRRLLLVPFSAVASVLVSGTLLWVAFGLFRDVGRPHRPLEGSTLIVFEAVFYGMLVLTVAGAGLGAAAAARVVRAPRLASVLFALFLIGVLAVPFLGIASVANDCDLGNGFPFGGNC